MSTPFAGTAHHIRDPLFTLATALRWLGHDCAQHCSSPLSDLPAAIWFVRRRNHARSRGTIVVVDPTTSREPVARTHRLIGDINRCTRGEDIHVLARRTADIGIALSIVTREAAPLDGRLPPVAVKQPTTTDRPPATAAIRSRAEGGCGSTEGEPHPSCRPGRDLPPTSTTARSAHQ